MKDVIIYLRAIFITLIELTIFLVLNAIPAKACNSYEDCMSKINELDRGVTPQGRLEYYPLKAIAYKLDEISKKLDKTESDK